MASFQHPALYAQKPTLPITDVTAEVSLDAPLVERFGAASQCVRCKIAGEDSPGAICTGAFGDVECGTLIPLYDQVRDAHLALPGARDPVTKYVAP